MGIFKTYGNNGEYPKFTVVTPQTGFMYGVRTLTTQEVHAYKESVLLGTHSAIALNNIAWTSIVDRPNGIETIEDFKKHTTLLDRVAILYGVYTMTWGADKSYSVKCASCGSSQRLAVNLHNMVSVDNYPRSASIKSGYRIARAAGEADEDPEIEKAIKTPPLGMPEDQARAEYPEYFNILDKSKELSLSMNNKRKKRKSSKPKTIEQLEEADKKYEAANAVNMEDILLRELKVVLPLSKIVAIVRQPTLADEEEIMAKTPYAGEKQIALINDTMIIKRFEEYEEGNTDPINIITDRVDIVDGYKILPAGDIGEISKTYSIEFGRYRMNLLNKWKCGACEFTNEISLDPTIMFFRMVDQF